MAMKVPMLCDTWGRAQEKARLLHGFRRELKEQVSPLCDNYGVLPGKVQGDEVDLPAIPSLPGLRAHHVLLASILGARPSMIHQERNFLNEWLLHHISSHLAAITDKLVTFVSALHQSSHPNHQAEWMIVNEKKSPIMVVNLQTSGRPSAEDIQILDFKKTAAELCSQLEQLEPGWEKGIVEHWKTEAVSNENMLVAALIPNHVGYGRAPLWTCMILLELPLVEPLRFSIPDQRAIL
ncbi:hypothetical protein V5O48_010614 [Marasmius crinis-equi]|uniref:Uncharacterized protein n=1 Tax=Marasmius crinis-equi TaxID=585013 RepID=A0ABR3F7X5_9AGAR